MSYEHLLIGESAPVEEGFAQGQPVRWKRNGVTGVVTGFDGALLMVRVDNNGWIVSASERELEAA